MFKSEDNIEFLIKIVLVGNSGVGKTKLLDRYSHNRFNENSKNTIGVDFSVKEMVLMEKQVKAQFWDTAGQEKFRAIGKAYYKNSYGAVLVYDITNQDSFDQLNSWLASLRSKGSKKMVIIVLGNKLDLEDKRQVRFEQAKEFCEKEGLFFMEVSAKENKEQCVHSAFNQMMEEVLKIQIEVE